jgi:hypothetical protein
VQLLEVTVPTRGHHENHGKLALLHGELGDGRRAQAKWLLIGRGRQLDGRLGDLDAQDGATHVRLIARPELKRP